MVLHNMFLCKIICGKLSQSLWAFSFLFIGSVSNTYCSQGSARGLPPSSAVSKFKEYSTDRNFFFFKGKVYTCQPKRILWWPSLLLIMLC